MRHLFLFTVCMCILKMVAYAQNNVSLQAGIGRSIVSDKGGQSYNSRGGGSGRGLVEIRKLMQIDSIFEVGAAVSFEQYNFSVVSRTRNNPRTGIDLDCSANYIFLKPVAGIGIGPKKIFHFFLVPSLGVLTSGHEITRWLDESKQRDKFTYADTDGMNRLLFRIGVEAEQQLPLSDNLRVLINEGYQFAISKITSSEVLRNDAKTASPRAGMLSLRIGISYMLKKSIKKPIDNTLSKDTE